MGYDKLELYYRHKEIDRFVFRDQNKEIEDRGFSVTYTGPITDGIEIGIIPYNTENAEFLYNALGREGIKVVEGNQAVLFTQAQGEAVKAFAPQDGDILDGMLEKQHEINEFLISNGENLSQRGINVTYTKAKGDKVEIGMIPYTKENADYLKDIFGDEIRVIAGTNLVHATISDAAPSSLEVALQKAGFCLSSETALTALVGTIFMLFLIIKRNKTSKSFG